MIFVLENILFLRKAVDFSEEQFTFSSQDEETV